MNQQTNASQKPADKGVKLMGFVKRVRMNYTKGANNKPIKLLGGVTLKSNGKYYDITLNAKTDDDVRAKITALTPTQCKEAFVVVPFVRGLKTVTNEKDGRTYVNEKGNAPANAIRVIRMADALPPRERSAAAA